MPLLHWCNPSPVHTQAPTSTGRHECPPHDFSENILLRNPKILCFFTEKQPAVPRKQSKCSRAHTREEKAMLTQSKPPCQLRDHLWQGKQVTPGPGAWALSGSDSAPRTLSFRHCLHNKGHSFHLHVRKHKINQFPFYLVPSENLVFPCLPLSFETSVLTRKRTTHEEAHSLWSTSGHKSLPLTSLLYQIPFWCRVFTRNADGSGSWVLLLGTCYN